MHLLIKLQLVVAQI